MRYKIIARKEHVQSDGPHLPHMVNASEGTIRGTLVVVLVDEADTPIGGATELLAPSFAAIDTFAVGRFIEVSLVPLPLI